jgi:hypothetical protein
MEAFFYVSSFVVPGMHENPKSLCRELAMILLSPEHQTKMPTKVMELNLVLQKP